MATKRELNECRNLARNLVETVGPQRALHAAIQYGWIDVANVINREMFQNGSENLPTV